MIHAKQLWTYELGERVADRIEFEELALRSVDPSVGPAVLPTAGTSKQVNESQSLPKVCMLQSGAADPLTRPHTGTFHLPSSLISHLWKRSRPAPSARSPANTFGDSWTATSKGVLFMDARRTPHYSDRTDTYVYLLCTNICHLPAISPVCAYVALIPNLPLFFCVWRSWSHYRG